MLDNVDRIAYRPSEVAEALGCTRQHVHRLIADGTLPSVLLGRARFVSAEALRRLLEGGTDANA